MIKLDRLTKLFAGGQLAVDNLTLEVGAGEVCVLVGPSGCGKTTTLKMINRLVEPTGGAIFIEGDNALDLDPIALRRRIGYVIQQVGLFPHMTVGANVAVVPKLLKWDKARIRDRVRELLHLVGLDPDIHTDRYPHQLSGGQQQRVGVARALGANPPVLLMDEPFGAIDPITRARLQEEFLRLQAELKKTVVFVTHDIEEAIQLGDRIAVLRQGGVLAQYDTPARLLARPASPFVADFVGADRHLKRLAVTKIGAVWLDTPPVLGADADVGDARIALSQDGAAFGLVASDDGRLEGWFDGDMLTGSGPVAGCMATAVATVPRSASLRDALNRILENDHGWVAVVEDGLPVGTLTPAGIHAALRDAPGSRGSDGEEHPS